MRILVLFSQLLPFLNLILLLSTLMCIADCIQPSHYLHETNAIL